MPTLTYNNYTIPNIINKVLLQEDEKTFTLTCQFLVLADTSIGLIALCNTITDRLTEINKEVSFLFDGSTERVFNHTQNTGFSARPVLKKVVSELSTETSRLYEFSVTVGLPFEQSPYNGRREASYIISWGQSKQRTFTFHVLYTALPLNTSAYDAYSTYGKTWMLSVMALFGGTYEQIDERVDLEQENKICKATVIYKEILSNQTNIVDEPGLVDLYVEYSVNVAQEADASVVDPLQRGNPTVQIILSFSSRVDHNIVSNEEDINAYYTNKLRPYILTKATNILGLKEYGRGYQFSCIHESKQIDVHNYRISGTLIALTWETGFQTIEYSEYMTITIDENVVNSKIWDGNPHSYAIWKMGQSKRLQRFITVSKLNEIPIDVIDIEPLPGDYDPTGAGETGVWLLLASSCTFRIKAISINTPSVSGGKEDRIFTRNVREDYLWTGADSVDEGGV